MPLDTIQPSVWGLKYVVDTISQSSLCVEKNFVNETMWNENSPEFKAKE